MLYKHKVATDQKFQIYLTLCFAARHCDVLAFFYIDMLIVGLSRECIRNGSLKSKMGETTLKLTISLTTVKSSTLIDKNRFNTPLHYIDICGTTTCCQGMTTMSENMHYYIAVSYQ